MDLTQASKPEIWKLLAPSPGAWICLTVMIGVLAWLVARYRSIWRDDADDDASPDQMLRQFQESQREGVLSAEEYRLIKSRLMNHVAPATETERREPAAKSTESAKGCAATNTLPQEAGETNTKTDETR
jgi:hypothetical protein